ncbi:MAG: ATP-binding protein [Anaerolineaceae bacterium]|nr:ATP-binding protein [Anaerolineaceae bacterium]
MVLVIFFIFVPLTALFIGIRFPQAAAIPVPEMPVELRAPVIMIFAAIPWVLAAGILDPISSLLVASFSGLFIASWETHDIFTILEYGGIALFYSIAVRQRYRTTFYRYLRHPVITSFVLTLIVAPIILFSIFVQTKGGTAVRLDHALTQSWTLVLARSMEILIASLIAEFLYLSKFRYWGKSDKLVPSPVESSISLRFIFYVTPIMGIAFLALLMGDWEVAGNASRRMFEDRLSSTSKVAAESLPYFLETGQNLMLSFVDENIFGLPPSQITAELSSHLRSVPYFRSLILFDSQGEMIAAYPDIELEHLEMTQQEMAGINLALRGVLIQAYSVPPASGESAARVSFIAGIESQEDMVEGVLVGYTDLITNPFTQPAIQAIETMREVEGNGMILDENHRILYHSDPALVMTEYYGEVPDSGRFSDETSPMGTRQLVYFQPVAGRPWVVVLTVPAVQIQQLALEIAVPLLLILILLTCIIILVWRFVVKNITSSLHTLAYEATLISKGQFDHSLNVTDVDEIGQFADAFEQMRRSLRARLEELSSLLKVSRGVAAHLDIGEAILPVLRAACRVGNCTARVVLFRGENIVSSNDEIVTYGIGRNSEKYSRLDKQIYELMRDQDYLVIPNVARFRRLRSDQQLPGSLIAFSLNDNDDYYGSLWLAYDSSHYFSEEEIRFLSTLAGYAGLAAMNANLFTRAQIGRQRLEAVLVSTPEPVLVFDEQLRLLILNSAAKEVPGLVAISEPGEPVAKVVGHTEIFKIITQELGEKLVTGEIPMPDGKVYYVSVAPVTTNGNSVGRICMLRDVTYYKELDTIKSDFVSTVSHDLRSPLTLMRGYATMLDMVGKLNSQQSSYIQKILLGVDNMTRLVNNLLDLGRIETGIGLRITKLSCLELIRNVLSSLEPQAAHKNISLKIREIDQKNPIIEADPALLEQSLLNLIENAIKYSPIRGSVEIGVKLEDETVIFSVSDNGIGIAPLDLPHMFEKFYRSGRREAYKEHGAGLGLAIVKTVTQRHGGKLWVESQLGSGSTFFLEIPIKQHQNIDKPPEKMEINL